MRLCYFEGGGERLIMCYSAMVERDLEELERSFSAVLDPNSLRSLKIADTATLPSRIYPHDVSLVIVKSSKEDEAKRTILPMRYSIYNSDNADEGAPTPYNARRDHLSSPFWSAAFGVHHGIVILKSFFEWVKVEHLVKSGLVSLNDIKDIREQFLQESERRKKRLKEQGKKYTPTKTELQDPLKRNVIVQFKPTKESRLVVPVVYTETKQKDESLKYGFAIITDDPPAEVEKTGHNRCPVVIKRENIDDWLNPKSRHASELDDLLSQGSKEVFIPSLVKTEGTDG